MSNKLLFDESMPKALSLHFPKKYEVSTVQKMGWNGKKNGELLSLAAIAGFYAFITADRSIEYQQNTKKLPIRVIIMSTYPSHIKNLKLLVPEVVMTLTRCTKMCITVYDPKDMYVKGLIKKS